MGESLNLLEVLSCRASSSYSSSKHSGPELRQHLRMQQPQTLQAVLCLAQEREAVTTEERPARSQPAVCQAQPCGSETESSLSTLSLLQEFITLCRAMAASDLQDCRPCQGRQRRGGPGAGPASAGEPGNFSDLQGAVYCHHGSGDSSKTGILTCNQCCTDWKCTSGLWDEINRESAASMGLWSQWSSLAIRGGILQQRWQKPADREVRWQVVVPGSLKTAVLQANLRTLAEILFCCPPNTAEDYVTKELMVRL
ncbi:UNVERIFIED_CONTAM: hypothetical protein FKN15_035644 [Acipenser sinensis]